MHATGGTFSAYRRQHDGSRGKSGTVAPLCTNGPSPQDGAARAGRESAPGLSSCAPPRGDAKPRGGPAMAPHVAQPTATTPVAPVKLPLKAIAPWAAFFGLLMLVLLYFVGAE